MTNPAQLNGLRDDELIARVAAFDEAAFEVLYDRHRCRAFGLALRVTGTRTAAEEVTQEAFLSLWRGARRFDPARGTLAAWLMTAVRHRAIDAVRKGAVRGPTLEWRDVIPEREGRDATHELIVAAEESRRARTLLDRLPADQREVVELAYFGGLAQTEIAQRVGVPVGTVKGRSRLALEKLRDAVAADGVLARV